VDFAEGREPPVARDDYEVFGLRVVRANDKRVQQTMCADKCDEAAMRLLVGLDTTRVVSTGMQTGK